MIKHGIYKHFKGQLYLVIGSAIHSETHEEMVIYVPLNSRDSDWWVRPLATFEEKVHTGVKRF